VPLRLTGQDRVPVDGWYPTTGRIDDAAPGRGDEPVATATLGHGILDPRLEAPSLCESVGMAELPFPRSPRIGRRRRGHALRSPTPPSTRWPPHGREPSDRVGNDAAARSRLKIATRPCKRAQVRSNLEPGSP